MKFSLAAIAALAASAHAQRNPSPNNEFGSVIRPEGMEEVSTGTNYTIEWTVGAGFEDVPVNIILIGGNSVGTQVPRINITRGLENTGKYDWEVDLGLGGLAYNGIIVESAENPDVDYQYTERFLIIEDPSYSASSAPPTTTGPITVTSQTTITTTTSTETTTSAESSTDAPSSDGPSTTATTVTSTPILTSSDSAAPAESSAAPPESGAAPVKAGILAVFGGFAFALFL